MAIYRRPTRSGNSRRGPRLYHTVVIRKTAVLFHRLCAIIDVEAPASPSSESGSINGQGTCGKLWKSAPSATRAATA